MIKKFFKDITGITAREERLKVEAELQKIEAEQAAIKRKEAAEKRRAKKEIEQLSPKDIATKRKEPWVDVVGFKVNKDNIKNGFYELDWNEYFITQLKKEGYGYDGDPDEEIVASTKYQFIFGVWCLDILGLTYWAAEKLGGDADVPLFAAVGLLATAASIRFFYNQKETN